MNVPGRKIWLVSKYWTEPMVMHARMPWGLQKITYTSPLLFSIVTLSTFEASKSIMSLMAFEIEEPMVSMDSESISVLRRESDILVFRMGVSKVEKV